MSFVLANRVQESSLSTGSGNLSLAGAVAGYQAFSGVLSSGDTTYYTIVNGSNWEVGIGTYLVSSLSRDTILSSSSGSKLSLSGQSFAFICYPAEKSVYKNANGQIVVSSPGLIFNDGTIQTTASSGGGGGGSTYYAGTGLTLSGSTFHVDNSVVRSGQNISLLVNNAGYLTSHPSVSAASDSNNSGRTYIQDILLDSNGHVTGVATATETVVDTDTTYTASTGLQLNGTAFSISSLVVKTGDNISLLNNNAGYLTAHPTINATSGTSNPTHYFVQNILLDSNGHITGITNASETFHTAGDGITWDGTEFAVDGSVARTGMNLSLFTNNVGYLTQHPAISASESVNNSGRTYIQDILLDSNGHVIGIMSATETVLDRDTTYSAGTGLVLDDTTFSVDSTVARSGSNISIFTNNAGYLTSHPTISAASSSDNSGRTYIQDVLLDSNGHVTGLTTATESAGGTYTAGSGLVLAGTVFSTSGTGIFSNIILNSETPASTTNALYNNNGALFFNGSGVNTHNSGSYASPLLSVVPSATAITTSNAYKEFPDILISQTGIWKLKYIYNCTGAASLSFTARVVLTSGCVSGVTGDPVGACLGIGTPTLQSLTFSGPSGLLAGQTRAGISTSVGGESILTLGGTGLITPGVTCNNVALTGIIKSGYLEMIKIA